METWAYCGIDELEDNMDSEWIILVDPIGYERIHLPLAHRHDVKPRNATRPTLFSATGILYGSGYHGLQCAASSKIPSFFLIMRNDKRCHRCGEKAPDEILTVAQLLRPEIAW